MTDPTPQPDPAVVRTLADVHRQHAVVQGMCGCGRNFRGMGMAKRHAEHVAAEQTAVLTARTADTDARLAAVEAVLPDECWTFRSDEVRCSNMVGGSFENGTRYTEEMCCLPCRIRAALSATAPDAAGQQ